MSLLDGQFSTVSFAAGASCTMNPVENFARGPLAALYLLQLAADVPLDEKALQLAVLVGLQACDSTPPTISSLADAWAQESTLQAFAMAVRRAWLPGDSAT